MVHRRLSVGDAVARLGREEHCVDGKLLSNQRFVDDIVIFWTIAAEAGTMLKELNEALMKIGLQINRKKTQSKDLYSEGE